MKLFSYVVDHDYGTAPNPFFDYCTLVKCKHGSKFRKNLVESVADFHFKGEEVWVVGTGGSNLETSCGNGKIIYIMRIDEVLSIPDYYNDRRFRLKRPAKKGTYKEKCGDNDNDTRYRFVLISETFFYFGKEAKKIPFRFRDSANLPHLEKKYQGYKYKMFKEEYISDFINWAQKNFEIGMIGEPCNTDDLFQDNRSYNVCKRKRKTC